MASNKAEMADNQWMYSGFFRRNQVTTEWVEKTDVFLKEIFFLKKNTHLQFIIELLEV